MCVLRRYIDKDQAAAVAFLQVCLPESDRVFEPNGRHAACMQIAESYDAFWCLIDGKTMIGTVGLCALSKSACELKTLYLRKAYQGRGLGRILLSQAIEEAKKRGFGRIYLDTLASSQRAITLYEHAGFLHTKRYNHNETADVFMVLKQDT